MVVAKVAFLVVAAALVTKLGAALVGKLVAALVGHWVAGLLAGGKCRLAASDPRRRAQPRRPTVNPVHNAPMRHNETLGVSPVHNICRSHPLMCTQFQYPHTLCIPAVS